MKLKISRISQSLLLAIIFFTGCSHVYYKAREPRLRFYDKINRSAESQEGVIILTDGTQYRGRSISIASDSIRWQDAEGGREMAVPQTSVMEISFRNHNQGGADGIKIGTIAGGILGSVGLPLMSSSLAEKDPAIYILPGAGFGCIAGFTVGGIWGVNERFVFTPPDSPAK